MILRRQRPIVRSNVISLAAGRVLWLRLRHMDADYELADVTVVFGEAVAGWLAGVNHLLHVFAGDAESADRVDRFLVEGLILVPDLQVDHFGGGVVREGEGLIEVGLRTPIFYCLRFHDRVLDLLIESP